MSRDYGIRTSVSMPFEAALDRTRQALQEQGFGVLSEIDFQGKLKEKLGVEVPKYVILGACNPPLAHKAMQAEREIGLLLPCNVIVYEDEGGKVTVAAVDPDAMMSVVAGHPDIVAVAHDARQRLTAAIESLK